MIPSSGSLVPGTVVDSRYAIVRELGRGGMGAVYEAEQLTLRKRVALKVLQANPAYRDGGNQLRRFLREARIASSIKHRNVVDTFDFGDLDEHSTYCVMELVEGRDLASVLRAEGPVPWPRARAWLLQVLAALAAAHEQGIVHRDVKPANIMLLDATDEWGQDWLKVLDFGIAKLQQADEESQALTGTSELLGTATHMAPELVRGEPPDARTDLYALGVVAYQLLTGTVPFQSENTFKLLTMQLTEPPTPPRELVPSIPRAVEAFVLHALEKDPAQRHQSATEMIAALEALGDAPRDPPPADPALARTMLVGTTPPPRGAVPPGTVVASPPDPGGTEVRAGHTVAAASPSPPAPAPAAAPARLGSPTPGAWPPAPAAPTSVAHAKGTGVPLWMIVIPVLAVIAGIAVGLLT